MNEGVLQGNWNKIRADLRKTFHKLSDADMRNLKGDLNNGPGILQERYGYSVEEGQRRWNEFIEHCEGSVENKLKDFQRVASKESDDEQDDQDEATGGNVDVGEVVEKARVATTSHNKFDGHKQGGDAQRR